MSPDTMKKLFVLCAAVCCGWLGAAERAANNRATAPYARSWLQTHLRANIDSSFDAVHFIRDNNDPNVVTKVYVMKHADAIELVPIARGMVSAVKNNEDSVGVDAIKYNDGSSILVVSCEEDRFEPKIEGLGIDEVIKALDQPGVTASTGSTRFLYFPRHRAAGELQTLVYNVGSTHSGDPFELQQGNDVIAIDRELNALFFFSPNFSKKNIAEMLEKYDLPLPQAQIRFTVYELDEEDDGKIGNDFQAWKNQSGNDLFAIGGRFRQNWSPLSADGVSPQSGYNKTQFLNLSPNWNSAFLDFLVSTSRARTVTSGEITVCNDRTAVIDRTTRVFVTENTPLPPKVLSCYITVKGTIFSTRNNLADYYFTAQDSSGKTIKINTPSGSCTGSLSAVKMIPPGDPGAIRYQLALEGGTFIKNGEYLGRQTEAASFTAYQRVRDADGKITWELVEWTNDITVDKGVTQKTVPSPGFGFKMTVTPRIHAESTTLQLQVTNSSLTGWQSDGLPRITADSELATEVIINNQGERFVLGGMEKTTIVRSVGGMPFLRELPGFGWLFASESESTKKTRLFIVAECRLHAVDQPESREFKQRLEQAAPAIISVK